ncbi:hypothetical protein [Sphingobium sp.]|uniref:hypothetical protein n=1 Tax=Sphingobium sp. TaxID=1912891 RepID=UPI0025CFA094|nr:hypothetical protein [Sphingobium sp.]
MAKRPLKVFRTSAGFQDAYVAATSRKAALEAWGARTDLFASGIAEQVTDPKLTKAALAEPGKVIRLSKGTAAQHLAAAGKGRKATESKQSRTLEEDAAKVAPSKPEPRKRKQPKPSRRKLERADAELDRRTEEFADAVKALDREIEVLRKKRDDLRRERDETLKGLGDRRDAEEEAYRAALEDWQSQSD